MEKLNQSESENKVYQSNRDTQCVKCGSTIAQSQHVALPTHSTPHCLRCVGLDGLVFLPSGDPALTRRAKANSHRYAEVFRFSTSRKRNERQGVLVEAEAINQAKEENRADSERREKAREAASVRRVAQEGKYKRDFIEAILKEFPKCPPDEAAIIARHACEKYSGRVGRSAAAKELANGAVSLAVQAHIRHSHTNYDTIITGWGKEDARRLVRESIDSVMANWRH